MVSIGLLALIFGILEYTGRNELRSKYSGAPIRSSTRVLAGLIAMLGVAPFLTRIVRR